MAEIGQIIVKYEKKGLRPILAIYTLLENNAFSSSYSPEKIEELLNGALDRYKSKIDEIAKKLGIPQGLEEKTAISEACSCPSGRVSNLENNTDNQS